MKVNITKVQLQSIIDMSDDMESMIGGGGDGYGHNPDDDWRRHVKNVDKFLKSNNLSRRNKITPTK